MNIFQAMILGLLQGATEFLPVSSSGHLVLFPWLLSWENPGLAFDALLHLGTLVAVLAYFRREVVCLAKAWVLSLRGRGLMPEAKLAWIIILGTLPAVILGLALEDTFEKLFLSPRWASVFLLLTGCILLLGEQVITGRKEITGLGWLDAILIGLAQAVAIVPGISRSGATMTAGLFRGLSREEAARFSFLLAIPVILGAGSLEFFRLARAPEVSGGFLPLLVGFAVAAATGYLTIRSFLSFLRKGRLYPFAVYCWIVGGGTLLLAAWR